MIIQAKKGGANAVKFQTYKAEKIARIYSAAYWDTSKEKTKSQNELLFDQAEFDFIQARESECDDEPLPDLPANP